MSQTWKAGEALMTKARQDGDYRGVMLQGSERNARNMADAAGSGVVGAMGLAGVGLVGLVGAAALASGGLLAPIACAVIMQACLGVSIGGIVSAGISKLWKSSEESKASRLGAAVQSIENGGDIQKSIDFFLGDKLAAKLGGWRHAKAATTVAPAAPRGPQA